MPLEVTPDSGYVIVQGKPRLMWSQLVFARQLVRLHGTPVALPECDRLTPLLDALMAGAFSALYLETPDTNDGKTLSGFTRRFQPLLETALRDTGRLAKNDTLPRLHIFFADKQRAYLGTSDIHNSNAAHMGILRLKMPHDAPSRSYLKLAEAFEIFLTAEERRKWLKPNMHAVDLGAAPGGWTWQLVQHGLKVTAVDNGPLKGAAATHPAIRHLRQDGFRYRPSRPVDWVVCDMVEQPQRVAALMAEWVASGGSSRAIFNLKLPMKKRLVALEEAFAVMRGVLDGKKLRYRLTAKQLYHDREEVTVFLARS
jgi:23S rRNA (cytidine2498-2'-O)-methyltransferase